MPEVLDTGYSISNLTFLFVKNKRSKFHYTSVFKDKYGQISSCLQLQQWAGGCGSVGTLLA